MPEIINCPSCQRKLQVPESLLGQDVQCPTCGATFTAAAAGPVPARVAEPPDRPASGLEREPEERSRPPRPRRYDYDDDFEDDYDDRPRRRRDLRPHRGSAVLVLGILSLAGFVLCGLIPLILGPMAWIMGSQDLAEMRAGRMDAAGEGQTNAGKICGMIATILCIVGAVVLAIWLLALAAEAGHRRF
jgi:hypothetical protein